MALGSIVIDLLMRTGAFEGDAKKAEKRLQQLNKEAKQLGAVMGAAIAGGAAIATAAIKSSIDSMDELSKARPVPRIEAGDSIAPEHFSLERAHGRCHL